MTSHGQCGRNDSVGERRRYAPEKLRLGIIDRTSEPVQFREFRAPRWFDARLSHPDWPTDHAVAHEMTVEISVSVDPESGPVLTGVRGGRGSTISYQDAAALLSATVDLDQLVWEVTSIAIAERTASRFAPLIVGDVQPDTPLSQIDPDLVNKLLQFQASVHDAVRTVGPPRRRRTVTPALLQEVADVYRAAHAAGNPPTVAVAEHFSTSHRNAARWVGEARKVGILGPAHGTKPGEVGDEGATPSG